MVGVTTADTLPVVARRLQPVALDELTARAGLLTRYDRKYLVPADELDDLLARLEPGARVLEIDGLRRFGYESVYFDSPDLVSYFAAARGRSRRFKVRTRTYLDTADCFVEVKTRGPRGVTVKSRAPYRPDERTTLAGDGWAFARSVLDGRPARPAAPFDATLVSRFERISLLLPASGARATIDTGLTWSIPQSTSPPTPGSTPCSAPCGPERALAELAVVETKTGSTPSSLDRLLWRAGHRPVRLSKYGTGMAVLHPDLPAPRWRRTLDRLPLAG